MRRLVMRRCIGVFVALWMAAITSMGATAAFAQEGKGIQAGPPGDSLLEARTREVASQLRCPVCQGNSIQDSPSELAQEMKGLVREQLQSGKTPDEVKRYFIDKYGEWILLEPKASGFNLLVYLLPILAIGGGAIFVLRAVKKWTTPADGSGTPAAGA